jgi:hypothetical protein
VWTTPPGLQFWQGKSVRDVPDPDFLTGDQHAKHVKSIPKALRPEPIDPHQGGAAEFPLFAVVDGVGGGAERITSPSLDLDEGDQVAGACNEVDVAPAAAEAMGEDVPAVPYQPARGDAFTEQSERLSLLCHGGRVTRGCRWTITERFCVGPIHC